MLAWIDPAGLLGRDLARSDGFNKIINLDMAYASMMSATFGNGMSATVRGPIELVYFLYKGFILYRQSKLRP